MAFSLGDDLGLSGLALAAGLGVMQMTNQKRLGQSLLVISALSFGISGGLWAMDASNHGLYLRYGVGGLTGLLAGLALTWMLVQSSLAQKPQKVGGPMIDEKKIEQKNTNGPNVQGGQGNTYNINPPPRPSRNPNQIYQLGQAVGTAVGPVVRRPEGVVFFQEMYGIDQLNVRVPFEYQGLILRAPDDLLTKRTIMGLSITGSMQNNIVTNVTVAIIGSTQE